MYERKKTGTTVRLPVQRQEKLALLMPAFDDELRALAEEIAEARIRLGIPDQAVYGGSGFTVRKLQLQLRDGWGTVQEGAAFFTLGLRMLASDVGYAGSLFGRAALGNTLKPREVSVRRLLRSDVDVQQHAKLCVGLVFTHCTSCATEPVLQSCLGTSLCFRLPSLL